ncbi:MAG: hypothetical protein M0R03_16580 [Novosphingobium sp.]|nr:hypothetical protein [Novosphingobium sp.]
MRKRMMFAVAAVLASTPALAAQSEKDKPAAERPITDRSPNAVDVAATPVTDLNLRKDEIPAVLISAQERPYTTANLARCSQIAAAVGELDAILGDDVDLPRADGKPVNPGKVAQWVVGSFIPFRGLIREISGANDQERRIQQAIYAGIARRSFLKGLGEAKGCQYPARSVTPEIWAQKSEEAQKLATADKGADKGKSGKTATEAESKN